MNGSNDGFGGRFMKQNFFADDMQYINDALLPWEKMHNKILMITGATGLVGGGIADAIIDRNERLGENIRLLLVARNESRLIKRFAGYASKPYIRFICHDVTKSFIEIDHVDFIIHAASKGDPLSFVRDPVGVMNANYLGMLNVLEIARRCKSQKVLFVSSGEVYGIINDIDENGFREKDMGYIDISNARSCYAVSKLAAENLCVCYSEQYGVNTCVARLCHTYGGRILSDENRVIFQFMRNAIKGKDIVMKTSGYQKRSYCYIADAVKAIFYILLLGDNKEFYNVANKESVVTIKELAECIANTCGRKVLMESQSEVEKKGDSGILHAVLSADKIEALGFKANFDINMGVERCIDILRKYDVEE